MKSFKILQCNKCNHIWVLRSHCSKCHKCGVSFKKSYPKVDVIRITHYDERALKLNKKVVESTRQKLSWNMIKDLIKKGIVLSN